MSATTNTPDQPQPQPQPEFKIGDRVTAREFNPWESGALQPWNTVREAAIQQRVQALTANMPPPEAVPDQPASASPVRTYVKHGTVPRLWEQFLASRTGQFVMSDFYQYCHGLGARTTANKETGMMLKAAVAAGRVKVIQPWTGGGIAAIYALASHTSPPQIPPKKSPPVPRKSAVKIREFARTHAQFTLDELANIFTGYAARATAKEYACRAVHEGWLIRLVEKPACGRRQIYKLKEAA